MALLRSANFPGDLGAINISLLRSEEMILARASEAYFARASEAYRTHKTQSSKFKVQSSEYKVQSSKTKVQHLVNRFLQLHCRMCSRHRKQDRHAFTPFTVRSTLIR